MGARLSVAGALLLGGATVASAQVLVNPNQIVGQLERTTTNPVIQAFLDEPAELVVEVSAESVGEPSVLRSSSSDRVTGTRAVVASTVTVESSPAGIVYSVAPTVKVGVFSIGNPEEIYNYRPRNSDPVLPEPEPDVVLDRSECVSLLSLSWTAPDGSPVPLQSSFVEVFEETEPGNLTFSTLHARAPVDPVTGTARVLVRGDGASYLLRARLTTGSDPHLDLLRWRSFAFGTPSCDEVPEFVQELDPGPGGGFGSGLVPMGPGGGSWSSGLPPGATGSGTLGGSPTGTGTLALASVGGRYDLLGLDEVQVDQCCPTWTSIRLSGGPWGNERWHQIRGEPASGSFHLPSVMPSSVVSPADTYSLVARAVVGTPAVYQTVQMTAELEAGNGVHAELGDFLVRTPATYAGNLSLHGPPPGTRGSVGLETLSPCDADSDGDGRLDRVDCLSTRHLQFVSESGPAPDALPPAIRRPTGSKTLLSLSGLYDPTVEKWAMPFEAALAVPTTQPTDWWPERVSLDFLRVDPAEPERHVDAEIAVHPLDTASRGLRRALSPGTSTTRELRYCLAELSLSFESDSLPFFRPVLESLYAENQATGIDGFGDPYERAVVSHSSGTPLDAATAATVGRVNTLLPEGRHVLRPSVRSVSPGGSESQTALPPIELLLGCGQSLVGHSDFLVELDPLAACSASLLTVSGRISAPDEIARIEVVLNASPPQVACEPCGLDPSFSVPLELELGQNTIRVTAIDAGGRVASVTDTVEVSYEPSALDLRPSVEPLRVRKTPTGLSLSWEPLATSSRLFRGTLDSLHGDREYDHAEIGACEVTDSTWGEPPPAGNLYYLAGAPCASLSGSLGRDSRAQERAAPEPDCR